MPSADRQTRIPPPTVPADVHVCSLRAMPARVSQLGVTHLVSVLNPDSLPPTPDGIPPGNHLRVGCNDITEPREGLIVPSANHMAELIAFARAWNRGGPMLVHCFAGISRSTAAAYIAICAVNEAGREAAVAAALRRASPSATPNALMVALADDVLGRGGRMVDAVASIGRGAFAAECAPFHLDSRLQA